MNRQFLVLVRPTMFSFLITVALVPQADSGPLACCWPGAGGAAPRELPLGLGLLPRYCSWDLAQERGAVAGLSPLVAQLATVWVRTSSVIHGIAQIQVVSLFSAAQSED